MIYIAVGSTNIVKVTAVRDGVAHLWQDAVIEGFETDSGVGAQPRSDHETFVGSQNRARSALSAMQGKTSVDSDTPMLGVGLEGGVDEAEDGLMNIVWCSVVDREGNVFSSSGARFILDDEVASRIMMGEEMGPVMDSIVHDKDVKKKQGMIGVVTKGFFSRTEEYASIARLTIGLWYGRSWRKSL